MNQTSKPIEWLDWTPGAFARARQEDSPVLLSVVAPWCEACARMEGGTYGQETVAALVRERFVPIRVNADRRPDVLDRYGLGGLPTTAFLTADGIPFGGGTFLGPAQMLEVLARIGAAYDGRRGEIETHTARARTSPVTARDSIPAADDGVSPVDWLRPRLQAWMDSADGGLGAPAVFPHVPVLAFGLDCVRLDARADLRRQVTAGLDRLRELWDPLDGGFFHQRSENGSTGTEKRLVDAAAVLQLLVDAALVLEDKAGLDRVAAGIDWVREVLVRAEGGLAASQAADAAYYRARAAGQGVPAERPAVDPSEYVDGTADLVTVCFRAGDACDREDLTRFAQATLDRVLLAAYRPGHGVRHDVRPPSLAESEPVLLSDHVAAIEALIQAHDSTGQLPYTMLAAELVDFAIARLWDATRGAFRDRMAHDGIDTGLLTQPYVPFALNSRAARVLARLGVLCDRPHYRQQADQVLDYLRAWYRTDARAAAGYGSAWLEVREGLEPVGLSLGYVDWKLHG